MSFFTEMKKNPQTNYYRLIANIMIVIGLVALSTVIIKGIRDANIYNSPFDVVDSVEVGEKGFLPIVVDSISDTTLSGAPTLSTDELGLQVSDNELTEVMDMISSLQTEATDVEEVELFIPDRIVIPSISLDSPILLADSKEVPFWGKVYKQWIAPNAKAAGWHFDSATLGNPGNTVLNGHHNIYGEVFRYLSELKPGSIIYLYSGDTVFSYIVGFVEIIPEKYKSVEERLDNARWTLPSDDERITLISCWPYESNTHRVVVVAVPIELEGQAP